MHVSCLGTAPACCQDNESRAGGFLKKHSQYSAGVTPQWIGDSTKPHGKSRITSKHYSIGAHMDVYASPSLLGQRGAADEGQMPLWKYLRDHHLLSGVKAGLKYLNLFSTAFIQCFGFFFPMVHSSRKALCKYVLLFTLIMYSYQPCSHSPMAPACPTAAAEKHQFNSGSTESHWRFRLLHCLQHSSPWKSCICVSFA